MEYPLVVAFLLGLFSTVHCVGMCGGIMGALTFSLPGPVRQSRRLPLYVTGYNLGRIVSYTGAGLLVGALGGGIVLTLGGRGHVLMWVVGTGILVAAGLYLGGYLPRLASLERVGVPLWRRLEPYGRRLLPVRSLPHAVAFGMVWGWLPCGLVYSALLYTLALGGALEGALFMLFFGLGTLPTMTLTGLMASRLARLTRQPWVRRAVGLSIIVMALASFLLLGPVGFLSPDRGH